nr:MAG TPA: hypothetical protein [Caudoviricetes sp.]
MVDTTNYHDIISFFSVTYKKTVLLKTRKDIRI